MASDAATVSAQLTVRPLLRRRGYARDRGTV